MPEKRESAQNCGSLQEARTFLMDEWNRRQNKGLSDRTQMEVQVTELVDSLCDVLRITENRTPEDKWAIWRKSDDKVKTLVQLLEQWSEWGEGREVDDVFVNLPEVLDAYHVPETTEEDEDEISYITVKPPRKQFKFKYRH
jgi:hypothetical protein